MPDKVGYPTPGSRSLTQVHTNVHCCLGYLRNFKNKGYQTYQRFSRKAITNNKLQKQYKHPQLQLNFIVIIFTCVTMHACGQAKRHLIDNFKISVVKYILIYMYIATALLKGLILLGETVPSMIKHHHKLN